MCPRSKNHPPGTHSLVYKTNSTFIVSTIIDLRFFAIDHTAFPQALYKLPPSINNIFTRTSFFSLFVSNSFFHFHRTLFRGFPEACVNPRSFFKFSFCAFICLCNNYLFLNGFQPPNFYQHFSHVCPLPVILFSACKKHLNLFVIGYYTAG